ncbi:hypothetical protein PtB15_11B520 [Puccinia triticina]|nr:hypothetical protein PtB15_11B520 [Puccinia triticina]
MVAIARRLDSGSQRIPSVGTRRQALQKAAQTSPRPIQFKDHPVKVNQGRGADAPEATLAEIVHSTTPQEEDRTPLQTSEADEEVLLKSCSRKPAHQTMMVSTNGVLLVLSASAFPATAPFSSCVPLIVSSVFAVLTAVATPVVVAAVPAVSFIALGLALPASARPSIPG